MTLLPFTDLPTRNKTDEYKKKLLPELVSDVHHTKVDIEVLITNTVAEHLDILIQQGKIDVKPASVDVTAKYGLDGSGMVENIQNYFSSIKLKDTSGFATTHVFIISY